MDLIVFYPKHLELLKYNDDNDDAFRLIKQLNILVTHTNYNCRHLLIGVWTTTNWRPKHIFNRNL